MHWETHYMKWVRLATSGPDSKVVIWAQVSHIITVRRDEYADKTVIRFTDGKEMTVHESLETVMNAIIKGK